MGRYEGQANTPECILTKYIVSANGCWEWTGGRDKDGYGKVQIEKRDLRAHRVSYELFHGPLEKADLVLHSCDNPCCINPNHLSKGSHQDNHDDRGRKGRTAKGERHYKVKLTKQQVEEIRLLLQCGHSQQSIADKYGVHQTGISAIKRGQTWKG